MTDDKEERISIIAESEHISQSQAEYLWLKAQQLAPDHLAKKVERIRELAKLQKMRKNSKMSGKDLASGKE